MRRLLVNKKLLMLVSVFLFAGYTQAQEVKETLTLTLDKALEIALSENPTIKVADEEIALKERLIHIDDFKLDYTNFPKVNFEVKCSKGTYIRSLVNDFGKKLNNGACLISLRRTMIGNFSVNDARKLEDLKKEIIESGIRNEE